MASRFKFTGKIRVNKETDRNPWIRNGTTKNGNKYVSVNLIVLPSKENRGYTEIFGAEQDSIFTRDTENESITIDWEDRFDSEIIDSVASYRKHILNVDGNREEFITDYDFVNAIVDNISDIEGKTFTLTGQIRKNVYNGKIVDRFQIQNMYESGEDAKLGLRIEMNPFFWNKDGIDVSDFDETKKIVIDGYTSEYIDKENNGVYVPQRVVLDCKKIDFDNEKHMMILNYKLKQIGLEYVEGKVKVKKSSYKSDNYKKVNLIINYMNGAEASEFSIDDLTDNQREAVELGLQSIEDFRPKGTAYGNRVVEYKIINFDLRDEYRDGAIDVDDTVREFEDNIYIVPKNESLEDIVSETKEETKTETESFDEDDLFS
jgi:hypothetical protein